MTPFVHTRHANALLAQAVHASDQGRDDEAVALLRRLRSAGRSHAADRNPHSPPGSLLPGGHEGFSALFPPDEALRARLLLAQTYLRSGDVAMAAYTVRLLPPAGVRLAGIAAYYGVLGEVAAAQGKVAKAVALHLKALSRARLAGDVGGIATALFALAACYAAEGDPVQARTRLAEAEMYGVAAPESRLTVMMGRLRSVLCGQEDQRAAAREHLKRAFDVASRLEALDLMALVRLDQARLALVQGEADTALALVQAVLVTVPADGGEPVQVRLPVGIRVDARALLVQLALSRGDGDAAMASLVQLLEFVRKLPHPDARICARVASTLMALLSQIEDKGTDEWPADFDDIACLEHKSAGRFEWMRWLDTVWKIRVASRAARYGQALRLVSEADSGTWLPAQRVFLDLTAAEVLMETTQWSAARQRLDGVAGDGQLARDDWGRGWFLNIRGRLSEAAGTPFAAYHDYAESIAMSQQSGHWDQAARGQLALGRIAAKLGQKAEAARLLQKAIDTFEASGSSVPLRIAQRCAGGLEHVRTVSSAYVSSRIDRPEPSDPVLLERLAQTETTLAEHAGQLAQVLVASGAAAAAAVYEICDTSRPEVLAWAGCEAGQAREMALIAPADSVYRGAPVEVAPLTGPRSARRLAVAMDAGRSATAGAARRGMFVAVARVGVDLRLALEAGTPAQGGLAPPVEEGLSRLLPDVVWSPGLRPIVNDLTRFAQSVLPVLITGESGTGKDMVARALHELSARRKAAFLAYNCTTVSAELATSQLFGHRRGSFTGAVQDQIGLIKAADKGTLFLDEVGDLPLDVQPKLLRFLESGEIHPLGAVRPERLDVRIIAATNADLSERLKTRHFRDDLYYRLGILRLHVPPLRQRREDIPLLSHFFLKQAADRHGTQALEFSEAAMILIRGYHWPGNVRELRNEIFAAAVRRSGGLIQPGDLSPELHGAARADTARPPHTEPPVGHGTLEQKLRATVVAALERVGGNVSAAARELGISRRGLYLKLHRLGIEPRRPYPNRQPTQASATSMRLVSKR